MKIPDTISIAIINNSLKDVKKSWKLLKQSLNDSLFRRLFGSSFFLQLRYFRLYSSSEYIKYDPIFTNFKFKILAYYDENEKRKGLLMIGEDHFGKFDSKLESFSIHVHKISAKGNISKTPLNLILKAYNNNNDDFKEWINILTCSEFENQSPTGIRKNSILNEFKPNLLIDNKA